MINTLDSIVADLIQSQLPALAGATQVAFDPPNQDWRNAVMGGNVERLNVYLSDLREGVKFRSNERIRHEDNGWYSDVPYPPRLNCMYLMTAWSPAAALAGVDPTRDEHQLLYSVAEVLMRHRSIVVADVYGQGIVIPSGRTLVQTGLFQSEEFPIEVALPDAGRDVGDFWTTMQGVWRPALQLTVTIPVFLALPARQSPMVTTEIVGYRLDHDAGTEEEMLTIGGRVFTGNPATAVRGAYVRLRGLNPAPVQVVDRHVLTQQDGRFLFSYVRRGQYGLQAVAAGLAPANRNVDVPSHEGEYDLQLV